MNILKKIFWLLVVPTAILAFNIYLIWPLFTGEFTTSMGSIEPIIIYHAQFIQNHFPHLSWDPTWHAGYPYRNFYNPFLPFLIAFIHSIVKTVSIPQFYRIIVASFYVFTPVSLYFLVRFLTRKNLPALISALILTLWTPAYYLIKYLSSFGADFGYAPWRLIVHLIFGEGPHIVGLALIPIAVIFFLKTLRRPSLSNYILSGLLIALVALTNTLSLLSLIVILVILTASELLLGEGIEKAKRALKSCLVAFGLSAFWWNWSFTKMSLTFGTGGETNLFTNYLKFLPFLLISLSIIIVGLQGLFGRKPKLQPLFIALFWFLTFFLVVYCWYFLRQILLPQGNRYIPELELGASLLVGLGVGFLYQKISQTKIGPLSKVFGVFFVLVFLAILGILCQPYLKVSREITQPNPNIYNTSEYENALWLKNNTNGQRVYLTGSGNFWLNIFTPEVPQLRGIADGAAQPWVRHAFYQIYYGDKEGIALDWLKIYNVEYILVNFPGSRDAFQDFRVPEKFQGLEKVYENQGDVVYHIPLKNSDLAQIVQKTQLEGLVKPAKGDDEPIIRTIAEVYDTQAKKVEDFKWLNNQEFIVRAQLNDDEAILVQESWDPGWRAFAGDKKIKVEKDVIGNMYVTPKTKGEVEIRFVHGKTKDQWLGYLITLATIFGLAYSGIKRLKRAKVSQ